MAWSVHVHCFSLLTNNKILNVTEHFLPFDSEISNVCYFEGERSVFCGMGPTMSAFHLIVGTAVGNPNESWRIGVDHINLYISSADRTTFEAEKSLGQREWVTHKQRRVESSSFSFLTIKSLFVSVWSFIACAQHPGTCRSICRFLLLLKYWNK